MKKFSLLICTIICAMCAFAQESNVILPDSVWFTPYEEDGLVLNSVDDVITVHMDKVPNVPVTVMFVTGNGFGIDMSHEYYPVNSSTFDIELKRENWGIPYNEEFFLNLAVTFTYGEGDDIEYYLNENGEPVIFEAMYMAPDEGQAEFVRSFPTGEWEKYFTFEDAYNEGTATLYFTKEVQTEDKIGTIRYYADDEEIDSVEIAEFEKDWSFWDGLYAINFLWNSESYEADDLSSVIIDFNGISYDGTSIQVPPMTLVNASPSNSANKIRRESKTAGVNNLSTLDNHFDIYNLQGVIVKKAATKATLLQIPKGCYIVNGQKIIVR